MGGGRDDPDAAVTRPDLRFLVLLYIVLVLTAGCGRCDHTIGDFMGCVSSCVQSSDDASTHQTCVNLCLATYEMHSNGCKK